MFTFPMAATLLSMVELSNLVSVLTVIFALAVMVIFIIRLRIDEFIHGGSVTRPSVHPIPQTPVIRVYIPFTFKLADSQPDESGLTCIISSEVPTRLYCYWGVHSQELHSWLYSSWTELCKQFSEEDLLPKKCSELKGLTMDLPIGADNSVTLHPPLEYDPKTTLGPPPRVRYGLVTVLVNKESVDSSEVSTERTIGMYISIIHLQDILCSKPTGVLMQYMKFTDNTVTNLQSIFVSTKETYSGVLSDTSHPMDTTSQSHDVPLDNIPVNEEPSPDSIGSCVICQNASVCAAFLPCRHACVCNECLNRVETCPMCRERILSFFVLSAENVPNVNMERFPHTYPQSNSQTLQRWLSQLLGIS